MVEQTDAEVQAETPGLPYVAVLDVTPMLADPKNARLNFDVHLKMGPKAIVLLAYATGGTPGTLNPHIRECVGKGIPVFLLSKNYARDTGIQGTTYGVQTEAIQAGATPIKDVNVNRVLDVVSAIQKAASRGLTGEQLDRAIIDQFGTDAPRPAR